MAWQQSAPFQRRISRAVATTKHANEESQERPFSRHSVGPRKVWQCLSEHPLARTPVTEVAYGFHGHATAQVPTPQRGALQRRTACNDTRAAPGRTAEAAIIQTKPGVDNAATTAGLPPGSCAATALRSRGLAGLSPSSPEATETTATKSSNPTKTPATKAPVTTTKVTTTTVPATTTEDATTTSLLSAGPTKSTAPVS